MHFDHAAFLKMHNFLFESSGCCHWKQLKKLHRPVFYSMFICQTATLWLIYCLYTAVGKYTLWWWINHQIPQGTYSYDFCLLTCFWRWFRFVFMVQIWSLALVLVRRACRMDVRATIDQITAFVGDRVTSQLPLQVTRTNCSEYRSHYSAVILN